MKSVKNTVWSGILLGLIFPLIAYILVEHTPYVEQYMPAKKMAVYAMAVLFNMLLMRFLFRAEKDIAGRTIVVLTFLLTLIYLILNKIQV